MTGNGKGGALAAVSKTLIGALPPAFLVLTLLNIGVLTFAVYVFQHNTAARNEMLNKILTSCLERAR